MIFRKRLKQYNSIEEVFGRIIPVLGNKYSLQLHEMDYPSDSVRNIWKNMRKVETSPSEVIHITGDVHYMSLVLPGRKTLLTIHDYYSARRGGWLNLLFILILWFYLPAWKVRYITVISK